MQLNNTYLVERHRWRASTTEIEECSDHVGKVFFFTTFQKYRISLLSTWLEVFLFTIASSRLRLRMRNNLTLLRLSFHGYLENWRDFLFHLAETIDFSYSIRFNFLHFKTNLIAEISTEVVFFQLLEHLSLLRRHFSCLIIGDIHSNEFFHRLQNFPFFTAGKMGRMQAGVFD